MRRAERISQAVKNCCPTCGGPVTFHELRVDLSVNAILTYGVSILVPPRHAEIASVLQKHFPAIVPRQELISKIWGSSEVSDKLLDTTLCLTRRYLEKVGFGIKNEYGQGYRLVKQ